MPVLFTHLHTRGLRDEQLRTVFDRFRETGTGPAILMGDLNTQRSEPIMQELLAAMPEATDAVHSVLGEQDPADRVDWIITRDFLIGSGGMTEAGASDHPYFWVSLSTSA